VASSNLRLITPYPLWDSIFPTRAANPGLPKGLKPNGRTYTDVGEWDSDEKEESIATGTQDDDELLRYNCFDTAVNLRMWPKVRDEAARTGYFDPINPELMELGWWNGPMNDGEDADRVPSLFDIDHCAQDRGVWMHRMGMWVNQEEVEKQIKKTQHQLNQVLALLQDKLRQAEIELDEADIIGSDYNDHDEVFNPGSTAKLKELYFEKWDLPFLPAVGGTDSNGRPIYNKKDFLTGTNALSTSDKVHRHYLAGYSKGYITDTQFDIMYLVRIYRRLRNKILSTSLKPLRPTQPIYYGDKSKKAGQIKTWTKSWLYDDGYVHSNFAAPITNVGRYSSSGLNVQNIGNKKGQGALKKVFQAPPGYFFVGADINQAHIFIIANCWKIPAVMQTIENGWDPHNANARDIFKEKFTEGAGFRGLSTKPAGGSPARAMREIIKVFIYASVYGASPETIWMVLTATETDPPDDWLSHVINGNVYNEDTGLYEPYSIKDLVRATMPYLLKSVDSVRAIHDEWLSAQPEWLTVWQALEDEYALKGFVASYLFGRQSGDLGDDPNKIRNFPVLATESDVMRIIEGRVERAFPREIDGPRTGMFYQCHDSIGLCLKLPDNVDPMWQPSDKAVKLWQDHRDPSLYPQKVADSMLKLEECFNVDIPGWRFGIRGEADAGRTLKDI
jgi:hypothetical protein